MTFRFIPNRTPCGRTRREFLWQVGGGFAGLVLFDLLTRDGFFAARAAENRRRRITTGELNRVLGRALRDSPPRTARGTRLRVFYVAQTAVAPPTFTLVCNREEELHFSESRRIENVLRKAADFTGSPLRINVRSRSRPGKKSSKPRRQR